MSKDPGLSASVIKMLSSSVLKNGSSSGLTKLKQLNGIFPLGQIVMLKDKARLDFYQKIISGKVKDKVVLDLGAGSGILTHLALKHGAKKVYSVEMYPVMQGIFEASFEAQMKSGRVVLLEKDAGLLTDGDFTEGQPEVIVHEIFGHNPLAENVLNVFEKISHLSFFNQALILPQEFEIMVEPARVPHLDQLLDVADFQGFPFSKLSVFVRWNGVRLSQESTHTTGMISTGPAQVLLGCKLTDPVISSNYEVDIDASPGTTHLVIWMKLKDNEGNELSTSHFTHKTHWQNTFLTVPKEERSRQQFKLDFRILGTEILCLGLRP